MKRILTRIAIVMLTVLMCASGLSIQLQADSNDKVENIYVNDIIVAVGKEKWIEYSIDPDEYYDDVSLVWTSSDESIEPWHLLDILSKVGCRVLVLVLKK